MLWIVAAFVSAALLGLYDAMKKRSLRGNAVIPVLFTNTLFCSLIFMPGVVLSLTGHVPSCSAFYIPPISLQEHGLIVIKALIVLSSWILGYFAIAHLPLTIVGPINATRPVLTIVGAMIIFGESLNGWQWAGVLLALVALFLLSRSGKKEGIDFRHDRWIWMLGGAALLGACSGLYDKWLIADAGVHRMAVQGWYNFYQCLMMLGVLIVLWWPRRSRTQRFEWRWSIVLISVFITLADLAYFYALSMDGAMVSVVSLARRGSVVVSFLCGALMFGERNLKSKALDLLLVLLGMVCLYLGTV